MPNPRCRQGRSDAADAPAVTAAWHAEYDWYIGEEDPEWTCDGYPIISHVVAGV